MKLLIFIFILLFFFSCSKSSGPAVRLLATVSAGNDDSLLHTEYGYDNQGRITTITQYKNNTRPAVAVTVSYFANEAVLLSFPEIDPVYNQTTEVHLTFGGDAKLMKRIEYTHSVAKTPAVNPALYFRYDTLLYEYDAGGFLKSTSGSGYDSTRVNATYTRAIRYTSTASYTMDAGNLIAADEYLSYPVITRDAGVITVSGGSSEYHTIFRYTRAYPNQADFNNAAVLNEYKLYYEALLNIKYKNLPDQVIMKSMDRDLNGTVIFTGNSTVDIERTYNADGLLSAVNIPSHNTPYKEIKYLYGW